ncbi:hypothetical protein TBLA_0B08960 [Henningerozyma blattae CBS 6284]|uniref:Alkyl transferase n=1 Tax=Henningerozyma blattae (strain ATCC 34711 / CBS 6284 / DSM 70876 / NBRC 10599 / NRRL Y-10934 / UCD 77-7) TaxID=1071380 RepID=I2H009_HENB6|nr:hypothetical protein TBLA_0B08960 [Tetrapisispora blattae CBS 6284]CCH59711.1 hypothetical protein TBLA_0B08960 [Tetrapisispora blattae CBS 6284]
MILFLRQLIKNIIDTIIAIQQNIDTNIHLLLFKYNQVIIGPVKKSSIFLTIHSRFQTVLINILKLGPIPEHVSFIMDGNRRYAKSNNLPLKKGHEAGGIRLLSLLYFCKKVGINCVSTYAFSIENFNRPKNEIDLLIKLFNNKIDEFLKRSNDISDQLYGANLKIVGNVKLLSEELQVKIQNLNEKCDNSKEDKSTQFTVYVCMPYTSRDDIYNTINKTVQTTTDSSTINVESFTKSMYLKDFSNECDILIRTSGHRRLSDYMLWQTHNNSSIYFSKYLWPDFNFFQLFLILLNWSFFTSISRFYSHAMNNDTTISFTKKKGINLNDLPPPPKSISITGSSE